LLEHAKAMRHVVERGFEAGGEQALVLGGNDGGRQGRAQLVGNRLEAQQERPEHAGDDRVVAVAAEDETGEQRHARATQLGRDQHAAAIVPARDADHVRQRHREGQELHRGAGLQGEGEERPQPQHEHIGG
jgi:hypothetical protein